MAWRPARRCWRWGSPWRPEEKQTFSGFPGPMTGATARRRRCAVARALPHAALVRLFSCPKCDRVLFFEDTVCTRCGQNVGYSVEARAGRRPRRSRVERPPGAGAIGHYYWNRLIRGTPSLAAFRERFGDEEQSYEAGLQDVYPFVLSPAVHDKLRFVHGVIRRSAGEHGAASWLAWLRYRRAS